MHDGTDVIVLQATTRLMAMKSKYDFKDLYQFKKIMSGLSMNYEKIDACESSGRSTRTAPNVCNVVGTDT
jgi:hypothetical protein